MSEPIEITDTITVLFQDTKLFKRYLAEAHWEVTMIDEDGNPMYVPKELGDALLRAIEKTKL